MKILLRLLALVTIISALAGCKKEQTYRIGVSQCSQDDWRSKMNEEIMREVMLHENIAVEIRSADDSNEKQIADIRYFVDAGFDIIIVSPNEAEALTPAIREVYESGRPIVIFDRNIVGDSYTARIGVDDRGLGASAARYARNIVAAGSPALEIYGRRGSSPAEERHIGFSEEYVGAGGKILASVTGNWIMEDAMAAADSLLRVYPETKLIFAHNDRMAIGASQVARLAGRDDIKIIGIDAAPTIGVQAVADGVIDATFLYPTEGQRLIQTALTILSGEPYEKEILLPTPASAVDRTNADILLIQNEALKDESDKLKWLKTQIDSYWEAHSVQTTLFYAAIAIIVLLCSVFFLLLRAYWQHKHHQSALLDKTRLLEQERDNQKELNELLTEATQSKLMFFTNVSHDLRTPLTLIAEPVAQFSQADNLTPQQRTLAKIADKNVKILQRLINQILDFRRYENGKLNMKLTEVDFRCLVADWMESFYATARKRGLHLSLKTPESDEPVMLALDTEKMERVIFNLLSNAMKFTPANGSITVSYASDNENLTIKVADTGEGIDEREIGSIFEHFYQAESANPHGSGIGLALVKAFVEMHGGHVTVESIKDKGSTFTVTLPVRHVASEAAEVEKLIDTAEVESELTPLDTELKFDADKPLILVADDNKDIVKLVSELLNDTYNVITAANGREGLRMAAKYVPDLVVTDVMMPVMDGLEFTRSLKEEVSTSHIPVLLLTACSMDEQRAQGYESGADGYLSKPFSSAVLRKRIDSLIANRKRIKELWMSVSVPIHTPAGKDETLNRKLRAQPADIDSDFYAAFLDIVNHEMGNTELNVDYVASRMGLERSQFYRKIKALTNYSPVELIRNLRLKHGRELLLSTEKSISEIAYETGFSTPAYFTKCYRDAYGETPSDVRSRLS